MNMYYPPASRSSDPKTSHMAESAITDSGCRKRQCDIVLDAVLESPGLTAVEISHKYSIDRYAVSRRLADLEANNEVKKAARRKCTINNRQMVTWQPIIEGQGELF